MAGPLFNFSAFLGAVVASAPGGILGFLGLFGPGILLIYALMPYWESARQYTWVSDPSSSAHHLPNKATTFLIWQVRTMLVGMNASSIGLVFAACITLFAK